MGYWNHDSILNVGVNQRHLQSLLLASTSSCCSCLKTTHLLLSSVNNRCRNSWEVSFLCFKRCLIFHTFWFAFKKYLKRHSPHFLKIKNILHAPHTHFRNNQVIGGEGRRRGMEAFPKFLCHFKNEI